MRVAVASSGLGHVARGIETWAEDTAAALTEERVDVCLFHSKSRTGSVHAVDGEKVVALRCLRRGDSATRTVIALIPRFMWRWGLTTGYGLEQFSFWLSLWPRLVWGRYDILHVQDSMLAFWCRRFRRVGLVKTKEILAHGTEEPVEFLAQFDYLQQLAPWHEQQAREALAQKAETGKLKAEGGESGRVCWAAIPNFVDTDVFRPVRDSGEKRELREQFRIPGDAFVVGCVAAVKKHHKRIDYLIREFSALQLSAFSSQPFLLVAGARTDETEQLERLAEDLCPGRIKILTNVPRNDMPGLLRSFDLFVLTSLFEMMPIAVLEALATGLPLITNRHPVLQWMVGDEKKAETRKLRAETETEVVSSSLQLSCVAAKRSEDGAFSPQPSLCGGMCVDLSSEGGLADVLTALTSEWLKVHGLGARRRAEHMFARDVVIGEYVEYYQRVMADQTGRSVGNSRRLFA